jgi:hypothetical protein
MSSSLHRMRRTRTYYGCLEPYGGKLLDITNVACTKGARELLALAELGEAHCSNRTLKVRKCGRADGERSTLPLQ